MRTLIVLTLLLSSSWPALALPAQEAFDPAALAKAVAPYIDQQTVGVAHLRATRIQVDSVIDEWIRLLPAWGYELSKLRAPRNPQLERARRARRRRPRAAPARKKPPSTRSIPTSPGVRRPTNKSAM